MAPQTPMPSPMRTKHWSLDVDLYEEGDVTKAQVRLHAGDRTLEGRGSARRNPHDESVAEIGDEYAAGRALIELGEQLLRAGSVDAAAHSDGRFG
jgi:hypothetical protein